MSAPDGYEERVCWRCDRGRVLHADDPMARPVWTRCQHCNGSGVVWAFVYPQVRKADVRKLAENRLLFLAWNGTARERLMAEKEPRRREGRDR